MLVGFALTVNAGLEVHGQHQQPKLVQGCPQRRHLSEDVDAVTLVVDHLLDAVELASHPRKSLVRVAFDRFFHGVKSRNRPKLVTQLLPKIHECASRPVPCAPFHPQRLRLNVRYKDGMPYAIEVENLQVRYRSKKGPWNEAVRDLSFSVEQGEVVGFLGPNGAGKSSTLKALMGFVEPSGGSCKVTGLSAGSLSAKSLIGYLPEVAMYYPFLTPMETLTLYGELQGLSGKPLKVEAEQLLETVGLRDAQNKQNRNLSKGMLQRVGIAQALLGSPELLILDEVTSGLDPVGRRELRTLLKERQKDGCTLFFSSHELSEVEMLCDRIMLIDGGILVDERKMQDLMEELRHYSVTYTGAASMIGLCQEWVELELDVYRARFQSKKGLLAGLERIHESKSRVLDVFAEEGSLEDYFVNAIARGRAA